MSEEILLAFGLSGQALTDTLSNENLTAVFHFIYDELNKDVGSLDDAKKGMLVDVCTIKTEKENLVPLARYVVDGSADKPQVKAAQDWFKKLKTAFDVEKFNVDCGIGISFTTEDVEREVAALIEANKAELLEKGHSFSGKLLGMVRNSNLRFADGGVLFNTFNAQVEALIGPKTKSKGGDNKPRAKRVKAADREGEGDFMVIQESIRFPSPEENIQATPELLEKHLKETGGQVRTRFPPEPNGYLHIGHSKAMSLSFGYAKKLGGICFMRMDDTNPETERQEYIDAIQNNVRWLGHEWFKVTYSSDYFDQLYEYAIELIKRGYAFVCHQTSKQIEIERENKAPSPWRDRPIEENLREFERMKNGCYEEGAATLRMKMDYTSNNPNMWDHIAYRIKYIPHPHVGDKWCIYPSYDYSHCLVDSIENITHSLCTLEFESRHESYNWLLDVLGLYKPVVWEYGRLTLTTILLSKRKLIKLVEGDFGLDGWDDPRLPTISGYRRRGVTPEAIHLFCEDIGVTRKPDVIIPIEKFEHFIREHLNVIATRAFGVSDPIKLVITDWERGVIDIECPNMPGNEEKGVHLVPFCGNLYIERDDFKEDDISGYNGLALNSKQPKWVRLKYAGFVICLQEIIRDESGYPVELRCISKDQSEIEKPSGTIHWVSEPEPGVEPLKAEFRDYDRLFLTDAPGGDNWLDELNPNSLTIKHGYVDPSVADMKVFDKLQFERLGYYCVDKNSTPSRPIFNRTVTLKESKWKREMKK